MSSFLNSMFNILGAPSRRDGMKIAHRFKTLLGNSFGPPCSVPSVPFVPYVPYVEYVLYHIDFPKITAMVSTSSHLAIQMGQMRPMGLMRQEWRKTFRISQRYLSTVGNMAIIITFLNFNLSPVGTAESAGNIQPSLRDLLRKNKKNIIDGHVTHRCNGGLFSCHPSGMARPEC